MKQNFIEGTVVAIVFQWAKEVAGAAVFHMLIWLPDISIINELGLMKPGT